MLVLVIIGITSSIAVPGFIALKQRATLAEASTHFRGIRASADSYFYDKAEYPPSGLRNPDSDPGPPESFVPSKPGWNELGYAIGGAGSANAADGRVRFRFSYTSSTGPSGKREFFFLTMDGDMDLDGEPATYREYYHNKGIHICPTQSGDVKEGRYFPLPMSCAP